MRFRSPVPFLVLLASLALACQPPADEAPSTPERAAQQVLADVDALRATWVNLANAGDFAGVSALYTDDAVYTDPYGNVYEGLPAVSAYLERTLSTGGRWEVTGSGTVAGEDLAAAYGTYSVTVPGPDGDIAQNGAWQVVTAYQPDGSLKIRLHMGMMPAPAPGA